MRRGSGNPVPVPFFGFASGSGKRVGIWIDADNSIAGSANRTVLHSEVKHTAGRTSVDYCKGEPVIHHTRIPGVA